MPRVPRPMVTDLMRVSAAGLIDGNFVTGAAGAPAVSNADFGFALGDKNLGDDIGLSSGGDVLPGVAAPVPGSDGAAGLVPGMLDGAVRPGGPSGTVGLGGTTAGGPGKGGAGPGAVDDGAGNSTDGGVNSGWEGGPTGRAGFSGELGGSVTLGTNVVPAEPSRIEPRPSGHSRISVKARCASSNSASN